MLKGNLYILYVQVTIHHDKLHIKQPTRCIKYPKFVIKLHVSGILCAHHQELSTVHSAIGTIYAAIGTFRAGYVTTS
jgi:hypothetical protein